MGTAVPPAFAGTAAPGCNSQKNRRPGRCRASSSLVFTRAGVFCSQSYRATGPGLPRSCSPSIRMMMSAASWREEGLGKASGLSFPAPQRLRRIYGRRCCVRDDKGPGSLPGPAPQRGPRRARRSFLDFQFPINLFSCSSGGVTLPAGLPMLFGTNLAPGLPWDSGV